MSHRRRNKEGDWTWPEVCQPLSGLHPLRIARQRCFGAPRHLDPGTKSSLGDFQAVPYLGYWGCVSPSLLLRPKYHQGAMSSFSLRALCSGQSESEWHKAPCDLAFTLLCLSVVVPSDGKSLNEWAPAIRRKPSGLLVRIKRMSSEKEAQHTAHPRFTDEHTDKKEPVFYYKVN